ncbi:MAG TPA: two-component system sensor histidine kinase CreC [Candidatus Hydrogenedentes bacterium]|nr:two-component system sensor histidine kinase CreC [Candidatus Hydrogenedentota bacterium]
MIKTRTRLMIALVMLCGLGLYLIIHWILEDVRPRYLESMEESMVDMATLLAGYVSNQVSDGNIPVDDLRATFNTAKKQTFSARIYEMTKTQINLRVYVTDRNGVVLFDSDGGRDEGKDYSRWNDVARTLQGKYGARASRSDPNDPMTALLCVAAPINVNGEIIGVLTVCKPTESVRLFLDLAQRDVTVLGAVAALALVLIAAMTSFWITWPIEKLTHYVRAVRDGKRLAPPRLGHNEISALGAAFEEMRIALEGKQYVEEYVQTLTHQMKSPLSAIRGAAELLEEDLPLEERRRFTENIRSESVRIQELVDRMLQLSALENRKHLQDIEAVDIAELLTDILETLQPIFSQKHLNAHLLDTEASTIHCERFLVRQAIINLLHNAVDFSRDRGSVIISVKMQNDHVVIAISDDGHGIPAYAFDKVFDRFYSLQRPDTGKKSSGLGLAFVREAAALHGGQITLENRTEGGVTATLTLPVNPPQSVF